jgi:hypothetical protein
MSVWDRMFGRQIPPAPTTSQPEQRTNWEILAARQRGVGRSIGGLLDGLRGRSGPAVITCAQGHPVLPGSQVCGHGHYVG